MPIHGRGKLLRYLQSTLSLLLSPNGHIEHELHVINEKETIYLIVENKSKQSILEFLNKMVFLSKVQITDESKNLATVFEPIRKIHEKSKDVKHETLRKRK